MKRVRFSLPELRDYRAQASTLESLEGASDEEGVLGEGGNPPQAFQMERASSGIFEMLHVHPVLGRGFLPGDDKPGAAPVVLLGYGIWKERYGSSPGVIGRAVRVNEKPATIIGVMPEGFKFPGDYGFWMPLTPTPELEKRDNRPLQVFGMLKPGGALRRPTWNERNRSPACHAVPGHGQRFHQSVSKPFISTITAEASG